MARHSRRSRKGGDKIDDIQSHLNELQKLVNELKSNTKSHEIVDEIVEEKDTPEEVVEEVVEEEEVKPEVDKYWVADKSIKFSDGVGGRVKLSFDRIMTHLNTNIKKGDTNKDWETIKSKLLDANSEDDVKDVIKEYKLDFYSNYVAGSRRRKRGGKKRTSKRR
jgi:hypothetical protein